MLKPKFTFAKPMLLGLGLIFAIVTIAGCSDNLLKSKAKAYPVSTAPKILDSYYIEILDPHGEGCVSCNSLIITVYDGKDKSKSKPIFKTIGRTLHSIGSDGCPSMFHGIAFEHNTVSYLIPRCESKLIINLFDGKEIIRPICEE